MRAFAPSSSSLIRLRWRSLCAAVLAFVAVMSAPLSAQRARAGRLEAGTRSFAMWPTDAKARRAPAPVPASVLLRSRSPEFSVTGLPESSHVTQANWALTICTPYHNVSEPEAPETQDARHFIVRRTTPSPTAPGDTVALEAEPAYDDPECEGGTFSELTMALTPGFNYVEVGTCGGYQTYWGTGEFDPDQWDIGCIQRAFYSYWYDDPSKTYGGSVTPATSSVTHVGSFPKSVYTQFTVTDDANTDQEVEVSIITCSGVVTGCAFTVGGGTSKIIALNNGTPQTFGLSYQISTAGSGTIKFRAAAYGGPAFADTGVLNITATGSGGGGPIAINMHDVNPGVSISRGACLSIPAGRNVAVECGDLRVVQPIPPTTTMNQTRAPALTYLSRHAIPGAMLGVDVTMDSTISATHLLLIMSIPGKDTVSYIANWNTAWNDSHARRVTLPFNAAAKSVTTGVYAYSMEVWALNNGVPLYSTPLAGDTLVVVDRAASPFGAGWWLSGLEQLSTNTLSPTTTKLWISGDGSTRLYTKQSDTTVWIVTPTLDRPDTLRRVDSSGTTLWRRSLGNGAYVQFDNAGQHVATVNDLGHKTRFVHSSSKLDSIVLPVPSGSNAVPAYRFKYATFGPPILDTVHAPKNPGTSERKIRVVRSGYVITAFAPTDGGGANYSVAISGSTTGRINSVTDGPSMTWETGNVVKAFAHSGLGTTNLCPVEGAGICSSVALSGSASTSIDGGRSDVGDTTRVWHTRYGAPRQVQDPFANSTVIYRDNATFPMLVTKVVRPSGFTTRTTYTSRGLVDSSIAVSPLGTTDSAKTRYTWHSTFNRITQVVGPTGDTKTFAYDTLGLMTYHEDGRGSSTRTNFGYDAARRLQYVEPPGHASNQRYRIAYDGYLGNRWKDTTPLGFVTETIRDSAGRPVTIITPIDSNPGSSVKAKTELTLNAWGCVDHSINKPNSSGQVPAYSFASISGTTSTSDLSIYNECAGPDLIAFDIEAYTYTATRNPYGRAPCAGVTCTYDAAGNVASLTTSAGTVYMTYDAANRLSMRRTVQVKDTVRKFPIDEGYASPLAFGLDFPALGVKFPYYPTVGDTLVIPADTAVYTYDADGNLLTAYNRDARIKRSYYPNGALKTDSLRIRTYTITGTPDNDFNTNVYGIKYEYDLAGRRTAMQVPTNLGHGCTPGHATQCTQTYHYVAHLGAVDTITTHKGHTFAAVYDDKGRVTSRTAPGGVDLTFAYDLDDRLVRRRERRNSGADTVYLDSLWYDARGKLNKAVLKGSANPFQLARFAYDQHGYLAAAEFVGSDTTNHVLTTTAKGSTTDVTKNKDRPGETCRDDVYDEDGRMIGQSQYTCDDPELVYGIDFSATSGPIVLKSALQYLIDGDTTMTGLGYESAAWHQTDGKLRFFQRVGQDTTPETRFVFEEYRYDALGRRVLLRSRARGGCTASFCKSAVERFVWAGDQVLFEMRGPGDSSLSNAALETDTSTVNAHYGRVGYVHGGGIDAPVGLYRNGVALVPHANWRGFYEAGTDTTGAAVTTSVTWVKRGSAPFMDNQLPRADSGWAGSLMNAGQDRSGLFYRRNRYYDPSAGHFTQTDPVGLRGGANLYGYAAGDPINLGDPSGLCPQSMTGIPCFVNWNGYEVSNEQLRNSLIMLAKEIDCQIDVLGGDRTPASNSAAGGAPRSSHLTGSAADINCNGKSSTETRNLVCESANSMYFRVLFHPPGAVLPTHVHVDTQSGPDLQQDQAPARGYSAMECGRNERVR